MRSKSTRIWLQPGGQGKPSHQKQAPQDQQHSAVTAQRIPEVVGDVLNCGISRVGRGHNYFHRSPQDRFEEALSCHRLVVQMTELLNSQNADSGIPTVDPPELANPR